MLRVALTGGIASGKSTISKLFRNLGVCVIDTDDISRELMQTGEPGYQRALEHFGPQILDSELSINRRLLRDIVFSDPQQRGWLESMLHPLIRERAEQLMSEAPDAPYTLLVVPLLFESGFDALVDHVVALDCPESVQIERLVTRDQINHHLAQQMIAAQLSNEERIARSDSVIVNDDNLDRAPAVMAVHRQLRPPGLQSHRRE